MFDREKLPTYDNATGYGERPGYVRDYPPGGMATPGLAEKATPPKRYWTRAKVISTIVIVVLLLGGILCIYQNIAIQQRQYDIQGKIGAVWNEVDRASQLLQQDAALLN